MCRIGNDWLVVRCLSCRAFHHINAGRNRSRHFGWTLGGGHAWSWKRTRFWNSVPINRRIPNL